MKPNMGPNMGRNIGSGELSLGGTFDSVTEQLILSRDS